MKRFGASALMAVLVLGLSLYLGACSGGGGGGGAAAGGGGGGTITNNTQGTQAASSSTQGASMSQGSGQTFQNLGSVGLSAMTGAPAFKTAKAFKPSPAMGRAIRMTEKLAKSRAANAAAGAIKRAKSRISRATTTTSGSDACTGGGTAGWTMTFDDVANSFTADITFSNCREDDSVMSGVYHMTATAADTGFSMNITLGPSAAFTISDYSSSGALIVESTMTNFSLGIDMVTSGTTTSDFSMTSTMTASGDMNLHDYFSLDDFSLTFSNFSTVFVMSASNFSITSNGNFSESWTDAAGANSVAASFSNLKLDITDTAAYEDIDLSGSFTINFTPDSLCLDGTFTFVTSTKIRFDNNLGHTIAGVVTINGVTEIKFNADGTVTVTTAGTSQTYNSEYELEQVCPIATLDETEPASSGTGGTTSAANASMTITLTWDSTDGTSNSDMDLHMNYYATQTPTAATTGTWYIDYHSGSSGCTNPAGVDLGFDNVDVDGDGICDIGLDFDNLEGYGPEHITATKLAAGYYVISVNAFSSADATVPVNVSIQIGNSMFGPFTHTFASANTISDLEAGGSTNAAAWFAVADMVVDSAGNVTVKAHDTALELWHDGAFGMFAPKRTKGL